VHAADTGLEGVGQAKSSGARQEQIAHRSSHTQADRLARQTADHFRPPLRPSTERSIEVRGPQRLAQLREYFRWMHSADRSSVNDRVGITASIARSFRRG
jgi:hypothetical protein